MPENNEVKLVVTETPVQPLPSAGTPVVPVKWVPWLTMLALIVGGVMALPAAGVALPPVVLTILGVAQAILVALGIGSAGARK